MHAVHLGPRVRDQPGHLGLHDLRAVEEIVVLQQVGLEGQHLLHPQRPLLVPGAWQAECLVPRRQLYGARPGALRQRDPEHLEHDPLHVVLGLRLGQSQGVDLHAVAEAAHLLVADAVPLPGQLVPELHEGAHLAHLLDEPHAGVHEERDPADHALEVGRRDPPRVAHRVEDGDRGAQRIGELLHRRRPRLLQVVGADVHRVPLRHLRGGEGDDVADQPQRRRRREHVGAAGEVLLDDVVLGGAGQRGAHVL